MISDENGAFVRASSGRKLLQRAAARREETGPASSTAPLPCSLRDATRQLTHAAVPLTHGCIMV